MEAEPFPDSSVTYFGLRSAAPASTGFSTVVTNIADLQNVIDAAEPGDRIVLDLGEGKPVTLPAAITIDKDLTIQSADPGNPEKRVILYIEAKDRHFHVTDGMVTLFGLILDGGNSAGGIDVSGCGTELHTYDVVIQNCMFYSNDRASGGGVFIQKGGAYVMYSGAVINNIALGSGGGVYVTDIGSVFTLRDGLISGNNAVSSGQGQSVSMLGIGGGVAAAEDSSFIMYGGAVSGNRVIGNMARDASLIGGGGVGLDRSLFLMDGGIIGGIPGGIPSGIPSGIPGGISGGRDAGKDAGRVAGNHAPSGGGVYVGRNSDFIMDGGSVSGNSAADKGGGVSVYSHGTRESRFILHDGSVNNNTANFGGGVYLKADQTASVFEMSGGAIENNRAAINGGGICNENMASVTAVNITGGEIGGNKAAEGGGIWSGTTDTDRARVKVGADAVFSGNAAGAAYVMDDDSDMTVYDGAVQTAAISLPAPLFNAWNNHDIGYTDGTPMTVYAVTYRANWPTGVGAQSGDVPRDNYYLRNTPAAVKPNTGSLEKEGYVFAGWSENRAAATPRYAVNGAAVTPKAFGMRGDTVLYAVWTVDTSGGSVTSETEQPSAQIMKSPADLQNIEGSDVPAGSSTRVTPKTVLGILAVIAFAVTSSTGAVFFTAKKGR